MTDKQLPAPCAGTDCGITRYDQEHSVQCQAEHAAAVQSVPGASASPTALSAPALRASAPIAGAWISVDEQTPAQRARALAWDGHIVATATFYGDCWGSVIHEGAITHWMPLPEPPCASDRNPQGGDAHAAPGRSPESAVGTTRPEGIATAAAQGEALTVAIKLEAMAHNYANGHHWDALDGDVARHAAQLLRGASQGEAPPPSVLDAEQRALEWAVSRWHAEVSQRPLVNVHRRTLDDTWRQVIRYFRGDPDKLLPMPAHDAMLAALATPEQAAQPAVPLAIGIIELPGYLEYERVAQVEQAPAVQAEQPAEPTAQEGADEEHERMCSTLAKLLGVKTWTPYEGEWDDAARGSILNILQAAGLYDEDTGKVAAPREQADAARLTADDIEAAYQKVWTTVPHARRLQAFAREIEAMVRAARKEAP